MNKYNTYIENQSCDCLDWIEARKKYKQNDPRRLCKHIINLLDTEKLPISIKKYKDMIKVYKEREKGFRTNFDEIVHLENLTLLGLFEWVDVCHEDGTRYGVKKDESSIRWAKDIKPANFKIVEEYLDRKLDFPKPLCIDEKNYLAQKIKEILPFKKDSEVRVENGRYVQTDYMLPYDVSQDEYDYGDANFIIILYVDYKEVIVEMWDNREYKIKRNFNKVEQLKKDRLEQERIDEAIYQEKLQHREEFYDLVSNLLKVESSPFGSVKFNRYLNQLGVIYRKEVQNEKIWIIRDYGLDYGINWNPNNIGWSYPYWSKEKFSILYKLVIDFHEEVQNKKYDTDELVKAKKQKLKELNNQNNLSKDSKVVTTGNSDDVINNSKVSTVEVKKKDNPEPLKKKWFFNIF